MISASPRLEIGNPEADLLLTCAAADLDDEGRLKASALLSEPLDWDLVITSARHHRLLLLLRTHLETLGAPLPEGAWRTLTHIADRQVARNLALAGELIRVLEVLEKGRVHALTVKGPALAVLLYGGLGLRPFADVDVVVEPGAGEAARRLLVEAGYRPRKPRAGWRKVGLASSTKAEPFVAPGGQTVDLHWALFDPHLGISSRFQHRAFQRVASVPLGEHAVPTLAPEDLAVFLAVHGGMHAWSSLGWLVDFERLVARHPSLDWEAIGATARDYNVERLLLVPFLLSRDLLGTAIPVTIGSRVARDGGAVAAAGRLEGRIRDSLRTGTPITVSRPGRVRLRERARDRVREVWSRAVTPGEEDWKAIELPARFAWAYHVIRPARLVGRYVRIGIRTVIRRLGA